MIIPIRKPVLVLFVFFMFSLISTRSTHAACGPTDPTGYFEGTATSKQAGKLDVSLNLRCVDQHYVGELTTPVGAYRVQEGSFEGGHIRIQFEAGGDHLNMDAQITSGAIQGNFVAGDDSGPVELTRRGDAHGAAPTAPTLNISKAQWHDDLKFYAAEIPKRHANAFHFISKEKFQSEVDALDRRIDTSDNDAIFAGLVRIAAEVGEGHTHFEQPDDNANFPIGVKRFGDDYRVVAIGIGAVDARALGGRVVKIDETPIARVRELLLSLTPQDETPALGLVRIEETMTEGLFLHGLGIIPDRNMARYTLSGEDGKEFIIEVHGTPMAEAMAMKWAYAYKERTLYRQHPGESFWSEYLPDARTVYCDFRGYRDIAKNATAFLELVKLQHPDKVVIDLRQNTGGDYTLGQKFVVDPLKNLPATNKKGHLFVMIGPLTYSAGMSNAAQFRSETNAILVGEPIGEKPNSFQEAREMRLPNSHLIARYSTQYYKFVESGENLIRPDREIKVTWDDYKAGRDPVLAWVLETSGGA